MRDNGDENRREKISSERKGQNGQREKPTKSLISLRLQKTVT